MLRNAEARATVTASATESRPQGLGPVRVKGCGKSAPVPRATVEAR